MRTIALLALLLTIVTSASAHVSNFGDTKIMPAGPYTVTINPSTSPVFTNSLLTLTTDVSGRDGQFVQRTVDLELIEPDGTNRTLKPERDPNGGQAVSLVLRQKGNHTLIGRVTDENGTHEGRVWLDVYPSLPYRIFPLDEAQDIAPGETTIFAVQVTNSPVIPGPPVEDLRGSIELWNNDHSMKVRQDNVTFEPVGSDGSWRVQHTFPEAGMYHVRFASESGNFTEDDIPLLHTYATPAQAGSSRSAQTPLPASLAVGALALLAFLRRR